MRLLCLILACAITLCAELPFQNLAPNGDGTALYFSSSLRLKGTDQYPHPKIFVWEEGRGVRLYAQRPPTVSLVLGASLSSSTPYNLIAPSVSSDGSVIAITSISDCSFGSLCGTTISRYSAEVRRQGATDLVVPGTASLSPNGRYLLLGSAIAFPVMALPSTLVDLTTERSTQIATSARLSRHAVADDGTVVVWREGNFRLRSGETGEELPVNIDVRSFPKINRSATRLFNARFLASYSGGALVVYDIASNSTRDLAPLADINTAPIFDISDDGAIAACIERGRVWVIRTTDSQRVQIVDFAGAPTDLALSGDGSKLFLIVGGSQILRFDLGTLARDEIVPETPYYEVADWRLARGVQNGYIGRGGAFLLEAPGLPKVASVRLSSRAVHMLPSGPDQVGFQVPWDAPEEIGRLELDLAVESRSPFQSAFNWAVIGVRTYAPQLYRDGSRVAALHEDFSSPISVENPARGGEIIHAYGSGFGPVSPQPELGEAAKSNPLSSVTTPVVCVVSQRSDSYPAQVLFAGLAPGWISLYQIDVRLPETLDSSEAHLSCRIRDQLGDYVAGGILPVAAGR